MTIKWAIGGKSTNWAALSIPRQAAAVLVEIIVRRNHDSEHFHRRCSAQITILYFLP